MPGRAKIVDVQIGELVCTAGQVIDHVEFPCPPSLVQDHVVNLRYHQRRDDRRLAGAAEDLEHRVMHRMHDGCAGEVAGGVNDQLRHEAFSTPSAPNPAESCSSTLSM